MKKISFIFFPLGIALLVDILLHWADRTNLILSARFDIGHVILIIGIFITLLLLIYWLGEINHQKNTRLEIKKCRNLSQQEHQRFLKRLNHELKNPLTTMLSGLSLLEDMLKDKPEAGDLLKVLFNNTRRLGNLTENLNRLAEINERSFEFVPVDLNYLIKEIIEAVLDLPDYQGRRIEFQLQKAPWKPHPVPGDEDLLSLALFNLLENALKYSTEGDLIEVRLRESNKKLQVEIADTGCGISEEDLPYIFKELYRGKTTLGKQGEGLGLAISKQVIDLHQGTIEVQSHMGKNSGTVFTVYLPLCL